MLKIKYLVFFVLLCAATLISCEKDLETKNQDMILGTWISLDKSDTLDFINDNSFFKSNVSMHYDHFDYQLYKDSIEIRYRGILYIGISPTKHKYWFDRNQLIIDFSNKNCDGFSSKLMTYEK
jgi:hypothetical protein